MCNAYHKDAGIVRYQYEVLQLELTADHSLCLKFQQWTLDYVQKPLIAWSCRDYMYQKLHHTHCMPIHTDFMPIHLNSFMTEAVITCSANQ